MNSNTWYPLIIAALYAIVHIGSAIAKEADRRRKRQKQLEEQERSRMAEAHIEPPMPVGTPTDLAPAQWGGGLTPPTGAPTSVATRPAQANDLARRRQQQLEQLRARRMGKPIPPAPAKSEPESRASESIAKPLPVPDRQREIADRQRAQAKAAAQKQAARQRQREAISKAAREQARKVQQQTPVQPVERVDELETPREAQQLRTRVQPRQLVAELRNRQTLRNLFVLKELIDPPLSLRD